MEQTTLDNFPPHNLVTYVQPLDTIPPTMEILLSLGSEKALAENAIWWFLENPAWDERDKLRLQAMWKKRGWNMFVWKHYRVSRAYLGGYKALSATLMLRRL